MSDTPSSPINRDFSEEPLAPKPPLSASTDTVRVSPVSQRAPSSDFCSPCTVRPIGALVYLLQVPVTAGLATCAAFGSQSAAAVDAPLSAVQPSAPPPSETYPLSRDGTWEHWYDPRLGLIHVRRNRRTMTAPPVLQSDAGAASAAAATAVSPIDKLPQSRAFATECVEMTSAFPRVPACPRESCVPDVLLVPQSDADVASTAAAAATAVSPIDKLPQSRAFAAGRVESASSLPRFAVDPRLVVVADERDTATPDPEYKGGYQVQRFAPAGFC